MRIIIIIIILKGGFLRCSFCQIDSKSEFQNKKNKILSWEHISNSSFGVL